VPSVIMCLPTDRCSSPATKEKRASKSMEAGQAASWQQVLEYNMSKSAEDLTNAETGSLWYTEESEQVVSDDKHGVCGCAVTISSPEDSSQLKKDQTDSDSRDVLCSRVESGKDISRVDDVLTSRSRSAQDLRTQPDVRSSLHQSTDSLLKDGSRTLPQVERLRVPDAAVLSRRRSFSGALHKAASAVAVRYRGLRDSLKAASADLLTGGQEDSTPKSNKVPLKDLGRQTTAQS